MHHRIILGVSNKDILFYLGAKPTEDGWRTIMAADLRRITFFNPETDTIECTEDFQRSAEYASIKDFDKNIVAISAEIPTPNKLMFVCFDETIYPVTDCNFTYDALLPDLTELEFPEQVSTKWRIVGWFLHAINNTVTQFYCNNVIVTENNYLRFTNPAIIATMLPEEYDV